MSEYLTLEHCSMLIVLLVEQRVGCYYAVRVGLSANLPRADWTPACKQCIEAQLSIWMWILHRCSIDHNWCGW